MAELTVEEVRSRVEEVLEMDRRDADPEDAHCLQDKLYEDVLRAVSEGNAYARQLAAEAVRVAESDGTRWFA